MEKHYSSNHQDDEQKLQSGFNGVGGFDMAPLQKNFYAVSVVLTNLLM